MASCSIMQRNAAVLTVVCILLCLTFNYTFPLHREGSKWFMDSYINHSRICARSDHEHHDNIADRTKTLASNFENAFKRFKDSTQDISRNIQEHLNTVKNSLSEEDLRQYEQLVIMKKYPYLDLKEIERDGLKLNFSPSGKNARQSDKFDSASNYADDPGICEPIEEGPNVEITNRGLTGFAIPAKILKTTRLLDTKLKLNNVNTFEDTTPNHKIKLTISSPLEESDVLDSLQDDILFYEENKLN